MNHLSPIKNSPRRAGVLLPIFAVYSKNSLGIGDFSDIRLMAQWVRKSGNSILQLLPLNERGANFSPYDAMSSFALDALYISLSSLPPGLREKKIGLRIKELKIRLAKAGPKVDYSLKQEKLKFLSDIYRAQGRNSFKDFLKFKLQSRYWLDDFALFKVIKASLGGLPWYAWPKEYRHRDTSAISEFCARHKEKIEFQKWIQWLACRQLEAAKKYCRRIGVLLKGDVPLLVAKDSADVWAHQEFFRMDFASGAPPDMYCPKGQRWGMPPYKWEALEADNFLYLKEKFAFAAHLYHLVRLDHAAGLFRIWTIPNETPLEEKGRLGFYVPAEPEQWSRQGERLLKVISQSSSLLLCAEDLGIVPEECFAIEKKLGVPGSDVQRWMKDWQGSHEFYPAQDYRFLGVAMLSTHDSANWPAWWEYKAGTIDEEFFLNKCEKYKLDERRLRPLLFDDSRSKKARLRWKESIDCVDTLTQVIGKPKEEIKDLVFAYENSFHEKEKLWKLFGLSGPLREKCDLGLLGIALKFILGAASIFCINTFIDWMIYAGIFKGDAYEVRINVPGSLDAGNWRLRLPLALEELQRHPITRLMRRMNRQAGRG